MTHTAVFKLIFASLAGSVINLQTYAQMAPVNQNIINVAVPFLLVSPDARGAGMGDTGVATSPDVNALHWNPARIAFMDKSLGASLSHTPWQSTLASDMSLSYAGGYKRLSEVEFVAMAVRYFNLGELPLTGNSPQVIQNFTPREVSLDATYSRRLSNRFSLAGTVRFIHSNLAGSIVSGINNINSTPGNTAAVDLGLFYQKPTEWFGKKAIWGFGANISNIGPRIIYDNPDTRNYLPANLRLGTAFTTELDEYNKLVWSFDINKLMVPTPQGEMRLPEEEPTLFQGIWRSFSDAPGGLREELQEIIFAVGVEYWYKNLLAIRGGHFNEHINKGGRKLFSFGLGMRYNSFGIDFSYFVPYARNALNADTMRFSLLFDFDRISGERSEKVL